MSGDCKAESRNGAGVVVPCTRSDGHDGPHCNGPDSWQEFAPPKESPEMRCLRDLVPLMRQLGVREAFGIVLGQEPLPKMEDTALDENPIAAAIQAQEASEKATAAAQEWVRKQEDRVRFAATEGY